MREITRNSERKFWRAPMSIVRGLGRALGLAALILAGAGISAGAQKRIASKDGGAVAVEGAAEAPLPLKTYTIAVLGDSLGDGVYAGLAQILREKPNISVEKYSKVNTGIVRDDRYDWNAAAESVAGRDIDVALMVYGANDLQSIREGGKAYHFHQPQWEKLYKARIAAMIQSFRKRDIPVYWLSLPITREDRYQKDYGYLNGLFREVSEANGATFIDAWSAFADVNGDYTSYHTVNGRDQQIRASDGVHFTPLGYQTYAELAAVVLQHDFSF